MSQVALALAFDDEPAPPAGSPLQRSEPDSPARVGFELGWDVARHGLALPAEHQASADPLRQGWEAGRASFGPRTLRASRHVRKWLQLRLQAWRRGRAFEGVQVTPHFLAQIDVAVCPITRQPLSHASGADSDASVDRVYNAAGYAAGNLAVMSLRANQAKDDLRWDEARLMAVLAEQRTEGAGAGSADGLTAAEWARLAVLMSFVTPLPHAVAASLPLLLLPPNRLRLLNPIQGLQALVTRLLLKPGYAARSQQLAALLPAGAVRRDFMLVFHSLLPRAWDGGRTHDPQLLRQRLEDGWRQAPVLRRWQRFAAHLDAAGAEALVRQAVALGLGDTHVQVHASAQATEGWALETRGYVSPAAANEPPRPLAHRVAVAA